MSHYGDGCFKENMYRNIIYTINNAREEGASNRDIMRAFMEILADDVIPELMEEK